MDNIKKRVYKFKTKNREGFVSSEINTLLKDYPNINLDKFNDALAGITAMVVDGEIVIYHCDIEKALICGMENRNLGVFEWD